MIYVGYVTSALAALLTLLYLSDLFRLRARAKALPALQPSDDPIAKSHEFIARPGIALDDATKRAASAYATKHGLEVVDLVAPRISSWRALVLLLTVDPRAYVGDRLCPAASAGDAVLVDKDVLARARAGSRKKDPDGAAAMVDFVRALKRYASATTAIAIAPGLATIGVAGRDRRRLLRVLFTDHVVPIVFLQLGLLAFAAGAGPRWFSFGLFLWCFQLLLATLGTGLSPSDRFFYPFVRFFVDAWSAFGTASPPPGPSLSPDSLRPAYDALLAPGTAHFFEKRRDDCPLCGKTELSRKLNVSDRHQGKPGRFVLERCTSCGFVFQNPRLSLAGLSFYYKDFYDGLGESLLESVFSSGPRTYRARADMVAKVTTPTRWLDVGAGHGHFCSAARVVFPNTRFDGLDLSESIEDAERRRWVEKGIRGLFPEVAAKLRDEGGAYDVVSMSHYLEHTLDPRAEIKAAARVLTDDGYLFIELPDPESKMGTLLGRAWLPWFQPQHIGLMTVKNLEAIVRDAGFEPIVWHRGEAHQPCDLLFATYLTADKIAPEADRPWRKRGGALARVWRAGVWTLLLPVIAFAWAADKVLAPLMRRPGWSNTYRLLAKRR
jgi:SAM-dependent methyltransferase